MVLIAVYGTLRKGWTNHYNYGVSESEYIGMATSNKLSLYVYGLPYAIKEEGELVVELYNIDSIKYGEIAMMELGAGYYPSDEEYIGLDGKTYLAKTFLFPYSIGKKIDSGDFNEAR